MQANSESNLSTGESAIYDRQIRLWGSNAQLRIKSSKVLFVGLSPATVEVAKNTVLAGANILLEDTRTIDKNTTNFLIQLEVDKTDGLSVAEATAFALHRLNEHPSVEYHNRDDSRLKLDNSISAVVVSLSYLNYDIPEAVSLSMQARSLGIAFFAVIDSINVSWMFSDFGPRHIVDAHTPPLKRDDRTGDRSAVTNKIEEYEFCDFTTYIGSPVHEKYLNPKASFPSDIFLFVHFYLQFHAQKIVSEKDPSPKRARREPTFEQFLVENLPSQSPRFVKFLGARTAEQFALHLMEQYGDQLTHPSSPHIAAILGALITQEVIKFVTKKDPPLVNSIVVHNEECSCIVVKQPPTLSTKVIAHDEGADEDIQVVTQEAALLD